MSDKASNLRLRCLFRQTSRQPLFNLIGNDALRQRLPDISTDTAARRRSNKLRDLLAEKPGRVETGIAQTSDVFRRIFNRRLIESRLLHLADVVLQPEVFHLFNPEGLPHQADQSIPEPLCLVYPASNTDIEFFAERTRHLEPWSLVSPDRSQSIFYGNAYLLGWSGVEAGKRLRRSLQIQSRLGLCYRLLFLFFIQRLIGNGQKPFKFVCGEHLLI